MASPIFKRTFISPHTSYKLQSISPFASSSSSQTPDSQTLISKVVSILKHQRSKSRWTQLRSLFFEPSEVSEITLQLRNNPHLALRFFLFTDHHSLCNHNLVSYSTIIHILSRGRLKSQAQSLILSAFRFSEETPSHNLNNNCPKIFETLVRTYRMCDSAPFVFDLLIKACLQSKRIDQAVEIVRMLMSRGTNPTVSTCNSLIQSVSKLRGCSSGFDLYKEVFGFSGIGKKLSPNVHTFNVLMVAFYRNGCTENVEDVWIEMRSLNCGPNSYSYSILMAAYCDDGKMEDALKVFDEMQESGVEKDVVAYNTVIGGLCKIGEVKRAEEFFREMGLGGIESTCVTFDHLINGYCKIGDVDSAVILYKDMCRKGLRQESLTIDVLIGALCDKGRVSEALKFYRIAVQGHGVTPREASFQFLIKGLCREGEMEEALKLQAEMVGKGFKPNLEIYNAFISGYLEQGNDELAGELRKEMVETQMLQAND